MIYRAVNLNPNNGNWDENTRRELLEDWRRHYANNNINMSPEEGIPQGGQGFFDSANYQSQLPLDDYKGLSPNAIDHPVNIAFAERQRALEEEFQQSEPADRERLSHLIEAEKDSHDYWQKNELFNKVLDNDVNDNPYPKELVDELRSEKKLSEENMRASMEDLINYDVSYNHPLSYPNRNLNEDPITDKERQDWCERNSAQDIKREYVDEHGVNVEAQAFAERKEDIVAFNGKIDNFDKSRIPNETQKFYDAYEPSSEHKERQDFYGGFEANNKKNRIEGQTSESLEEKIKNHNNTSQENGIEAPVIAGSSIEKRDERIGAAEEKIKDVIPNETQEFKGMEPMGEEKGFFSSWMDKTKEKVSDFKEKAVNLWEERVAPKLGIETERSRKEAQQEIVDKINRQELKAFDEQEKLKKEKSEEKPENLQQDNSLSEKPEQENVKKNRPSSETDVSIENEQKNNIKVENNRPEHNEQPEVAQEEVKRRRPSSGINDESQNEISHEDKALKNRPEGESSKQEVSTPPPAEDDFTRKLK